MWGVTDMTTFLHNGFTWSTAARRCSPQTTIDHTSTGSTVGNLVGTFGTNWSSTHRCGAYAGVHPFGYGPPRCEIDRPDLRRRHAAAAV